MNSPVRPIQAEAGANMNRNHQPTHGEIADLICEFLEVAIHLLLSIRGIYPAEIFERRRHFNVPVQWARHPELRDYIHSAVTNLHIWIQQGVVEKLAVTVLDSNQTPVEKFVFKLRVKQLVSSGLPLNDLEFALRAFFLKLSVFETQLKPLPSDCSWEIVAYLKKIPGDTVTNGQFWIPADSEEVWQQPYLITPIKSMCSDFLDMQLYVEHPSSGDMNS